MKGNKAIMSVLNKPEIVRQSSKAGEEIAVNSIVTDDFNPVASHHVFFCAVWKVDDQTG